MFYSSIKIALRNLYREKLYAAVNIAGLALAISCALILGLYLRGELTYDRHFVNHENIYRVVSELSQADGDRSTSAQGPLLAGQFLLDEFDEIQNFAAIKPAIALSSESPPPIFRNDSVTDFWPNTFIASPSFFEVFSHHIIYGDPTIALEDPQSVAVSQSFSQRYFGDTNPIGELLENDLGEPVVVQLVFADLPENTHLKYDVLLSFNGLPPPSGAMPLWQQVLTNTAFIYVVAESEFNPENVPAMSESFYRRYWPQAAPSSNGFSTARLMFEPLASVHYNSSTVGDAPQGNADYLSVFSITLLFILIVACINYTNLASARAIHRSKEVGVRKILGANRKTLMLQFLLEAVLYTACAALVAIACVEILVDTSWLAQLLGKSIEFSLFNEPRIALLIAAFVLAVGLLAGLYPAVYLSSWAPLSALVSSGKSAGRGNILVRQALVLVQFTITILVIAATLIMANQMRYMSNMSLGFDRENLVVVRMIGADLIERSDTVKTEILQHQDVLGATVAFRPFILSWGGGRQPLGSRDGEEVLAPVRWNAVDDDYFDTLDLEIVKGRRFSQALLTDEAPRIVNEEMVRLSGWEEPLGQQIRGGRIIGVVEDFNFNSLYDPIQSLALEPLDERFANETSYENRSNLARQRATRNMIVRIAGGDIRETLNYLQQTFQEFSPSSRVEIEFLDDQLNQLYQSEESLMRLVGIFAGICIFIAALGLFGLASFTTEQRSKEIAIRKVLGASTWQIILMLSKTVLGLVAIGAVIASIIAYRITSEWLASFAYRADLSIWIFVTAALVAFVVAFVTMALQSYRTAQADPVEALRTE